MSELRNIDLKDLKLDLFNYRTLPQKTEIDSINTMIAIKPNKFFGILESIIDDGYVVRELLIILQKDNEYIVKEGNRRIAALKLIHGIYDPNKFPIPDNILEKIKKMDALWLDNNKDIPCVIYELDQSDAVDKIINQTHGKGEVASRDPWTSVAKARHNRDKNNAPEFGLTLLEKYLLEGKNLTPIEKEVWSGDFSITILDEAIRVIFSRLNYNSVKELVDDYPSTKWKNSLDNMMKAIGDGDLTFNILRDKQNDFAIKYGFPELQVDIPNNGNGKDDNASNNGKGSDLNPNEGSGENNQPEKGNPSETNPPKPIPKKKPVAYPMNSPKHVAKLLKNFQPCGENRQKVVTLRDEMKILAINKNPLAFCFLLRSMFEISAVAYANDNSIETTIPTGNNGIKHKPLAKLLNEVVDHLTNNRKDKEMEKKLHASIIEISKADSILSVTSMNQLVHNPNFSVLPTDICTTFSGIYPLLEVMNQ